MPIYEYQCLHCGRRTEQLQRMDGPPLAACPSCGGEVKKLISSPAFQFKGSGWYATDYAGKKGGGGGSEGGESKKESGGGESSSDKSKDSGGKDSGGRDSGSKDSGSKDSGS